MSEDRQEYGTEPEAQSDDTQAGLIDLDSGEDPPWMDDDAQEDSEAAEEQPTPDAAAADTAVADPEPQSVPMPDGTFTEAELEAIQEAYDSGDARRIVQVQQIVARRTLEQERRAEREREQWYNDLGVTAEFRQDFGADMDDAFRSAPPQMRSSREGIALILGAVVAQRGLRSKTGLAQAFAEAARRLGHGETPAEPEPRRRAEAGMTAGPPDVRTAAASGKNTGRRASADDKLAALLGG